MDKKSPWDIKEGDWIPWKAIKLKDEILRAYKLLAPSKGCLTCLTARFRSLNKIHKEIRPEG